MKSRHLIVTLSLALAAGAAAAALSRGGAEPASQAAQPCMEQPAADGIARVVVTATREIPRIVVIGQRPAAALAANRP
jgi:Flp pilus assembly protein CpaB